MYTVGIGYERVVSNHFSGQILLNNYGYDGRSTDGNAECLTAIIPEVKYYINTTDSLSSSFYRAVFIEMLRKKHLPSGESFDSREREGKQIRPGVLLGKDWQLSQRWHLETYAGVKYRFVWEKVVYDAQQTVTYTTTQYQK